MLSNSDKRLDDMPMKCNKCEHTWPDKILVNAAISEVCNYVDGMRCPKCGSRKLSMVIGDQGREIMANGEK
jgi:Zn finger protein HypA/HybF involved in hydrogenase expression